MITFTYRLLSCENLCGWTLMVGFVYLPPRVDVIHAVVTDFVVPGAGTLPFLVPLSFVPACRVSVLPLPSGCATHTCQTTSATLVWCLPFGSGSDSQRQPNYNLPHLSLWTYWCILPGISDGVSQITSPSHSLCAHSHFTSSIMNRSPCAHVYHSAKHFVWSNLLNRLL